MKTTLRKIRAHIPCAPGWKKLLTHLGKTKADDEPLSLLAVLNSNGLDDALWCLRAIDGHEKEIRLYALWCARQVQHLMTDPRLLAALDVAERYAHGKATDDELAAARAEAWATAEATWAGAGAAACAAAWAAADASWVARAATAAADAAAWAAWHAAWTAQAAAWAAQEQQLRKVLAEIENKEMEHELS